MRTCNRCEISNPDPATHCSRCGAQLGPVADERLTPEQSSAPDAATWTTKKTLFGMAGLADQDDVSAQALPAPADYRASQKTLVGLSPEDATTSQPEHQVPSEPPTETAPQGAATTPDEPPSDTRLGLGPAAPDGVSDEMPSDEEVNSDREFFNAAVPRPARWSRHSQGKLVVAAAVLFLLVGGAVALLLDPSDPLSVQLLGSSDNEARLAFSCEDCADGTQLTVGGQSVVVKNHRAELSTLHPLNLGVNQLTIELDRPSPSIGRTVKLEVVVPYRIQIDVDATNDALQLPINFETLEGASITLGGTSVTAKNQPVELNLDLSESLGSAARPSGTHLSQEHPFIIAHPSHGAIQGVVNLNLPVAPLTVTSPGRRIVVVGDRFRMSGSVGEGATLSANGGPIAVDDDGAFNQLMGVSSVGQVKLQLISRKIGHAPQRKEISVKRVKSLQSEAKAWLANEHPRIDASQKNYAILAEHDASDAGDSKRVSFRGRAQGSKSLGTHAITVFDIPKSCSQAPCLVRVRHAQAKDRLGKKLRRGQWVNIFGNVTTNAALPQDLPTVSAEFIVPE